MSRRIKPTKSWKDPDEHMRSAMKSEWYRAIVQLQSDFAKYSFDFFSGKGFDFALLPLTTGSVSSPMGLGSDSLPVRVKIQGEDTYLSDSMQFFLEYTCRLNNRNCYYLAPSFRGENTDATHLSQFYHAESEIIGDFEKVKLLVEVYIKYLANEFLKYSSENIISICGSTEHISEIIKRDFFPKCTFDEAVDILKNDKSYIISHPAGYRTINSQGEKKLIAHFGGVVWLTHFDYLSVPFYQKSVDSNMRSALCGDLLIGEGETVGAGERHLTKEETIKALQYHEVGQEDYRWYLDMKDIVSMQTSGFGMGVERFLLWLIKHDDIRDIPLFPRLKESKIA